MKNLICSVDNLDKKDFAVVLQGSQKIRELVFRLTHLLIEIPRQVPIVGSRDCAGVQYFLLTN